jgi:acyl-CoA reductase-like NAD-dependent aldehyde dehydrogenase
MKQYSKAYIDGVWQGFDAVNTLTVKDSFSEEDIASVALGGPDIASACVSAARRAFYDWSQRSRQERAQFIRRIGICLAKKADQLAKDVTREVGMPFKLSRRIQVDAPLAAWEYYAGLGEQTEFESKLGHSLLTREPVGVVVCITPWNYPLHQITAKVAPALMAGCNVVLKPSELAPALATALAEAVDEAGLPAGVFNLVMGEGSILGEALVAHREVDMVSFTGSTAAGKRVAAIAANGVKRIALELGGKSASIMLPDADFTLATRHALSSCFLNSGQTCTAITRLLVPVERYDECIRLLKEGVIKFVMGDPMLPGTRLGPLVSAQQRDKVAKYVTEALNKDAELISGLTETPGSGFFVAPTILGRVDAESALAQEEVFGPVLAVLTYQSEEDAIAIANGTDYGLAAAVWGTNQNNALAVAKRLRAGQVDLNGASFNPTAPFGGFKQSGIGRENGPFGLEEFLETRSIQLPA